MKKTTFLKTLLLLCALVVGSSSVWADDDPQWSYTVVNGDASKLNTSLKTFTVDASHVWNYDVTVAAGTSPAIAIGSYSATYGIKFGESSKAYYKPVILSTSAFSDKAITKVNLYLKHNGGKVGTLTVKQGAITIGTATTSSTSDWINVTCSETNKGAGGTLEIRYAVDQALYINKIEVWYETLGTATTTTIDASGITNTDVNVSTAAGSLSASVTEKVGGAAVDGATVTWTSSNEAVATVASDGTVTLKKKGSTTITASYAGNATYAGSSADYELTVTNSAPQETNIDVDMNYEWLGTSNEGSIDAGDLPKSIDCEGVTITFGETGTAPRGDDTYIRVYKDNEITFTAPSGYSIYSITFVSTGGDWKNGMTANVGTYDDGRDGDNKTYWTGIANDVVFTPGGTHRIASVNVKLVASKDITITSAGWASFSSASALDFTGTGVTAYIAKEKDASNVTLTPIVKVPANTGIVVSATAGTYPIPVLSGDADDATGNLLHAWLTAGEPTEGTYYVLGANAGNPVFKQSTGGTLAAGKSYLVLPSGIGAHELNISFDDGETTAIKQVKGSELKVEGYYNLNGQRVAQPTKGLYIVNGKKVIVK